MAAWFPTRRCDGCSTAIRVGTLWPFSSISGAQAARFPRDLNESDVRQKDIRFSSRTRAATDEFKTKQLLRRAGANLP